MARNDHAIGFDLVARAEAAGAHVLVLTVDVPVRTTRAREVTSGVTTPFRPDFKMLAQIALSPGWLAAMVRNGIPRFANLRAYTGGDTSIAAVAQFARREVKGAFSWDEIARYRERWKRPLVLKGIMHPDDACLARDRGADAVIVSNHGGRQLDGTVSALRVLPDVVAACKEIPVIVDGGIRRGTDALKALALGARFVFVARPFNYAAAIAGNEGLAHAIKLLSSEIDRDMAMLGVRSIGELSPGCLRRLG
jgi:L-lactate dehydrogenase (cytochrome)